MTKITINKQTLQNTGAIAANYMPTNSDYDGKIVLSGKDNMLEMKSSDFIQTVIIKKIPFVSSDLTVDSFSEIALDGKKLLTVLRAAKTDDIILEISESTLIVKSGRSKIKIDITSDIQDIKIDNCDNKLDLSDEIIKSLQKVYHSIDISNVKPELNGLLLNVRNGKLNLVSTDTKRLSHITADTSLNDMDIIVPKQGIQSIIKLFSGYDITAEFDDVNFTVHTANISYSTRLINGKFPEWERVVPQSLLQTLTISKVKLTELVKEASLFDSQISINVNNGKILIKDFEGNTEIEDTCDNDGVNINFNVNAKNILDFLASCKDETVTIGFNAANLPLLFIADSSYKEICMPIVIQNDKKEEQEDETRAA